MLGWRRGLLLPIITLQDDPWGQNHRRYLRAQGCVGDRKQMPMVGEEQHPESFSEPTEHFEARRRTFVVEIDEKIIGDERVAFS
jgi:hypothetical protein